MTWHNKIIHETIVDISKVLLDQLEKNKISELGLAGGQAGNALFLSYLSRYLKDEQLLEEVYKIYNTLFEAFADQEIGHTHARGIAGIAWSFNHLKRYDLIEADDIDMEEVDDFIFKACLHDLKEGKNYDLLHGAVGGGIYLLGRLPNVQIEQYLNTIVEELASIAITDDLGFVKWEDKFNDFHDTLPSYNLGIAHGIPSVILFLSALYKSNISPKKCLELLSGAVSWILNNRYDESNSSVFPMAIVGDDASPAKSRLAWCYGDLGIAYSLVSAGINTNNEGWVKEGIKTALSTTKKLDSQDTRVVDAGFCHGTVGVAHMYKRLYENTGEVEFKKAALYWRNETLRYKHIDGSPIMFPYYNPPIDEYVADSGLLTGLSGVGLSLIYLNSEMLPDWDQCFLPN